MGKKTSAAPRKSQASEETVPDFSVASSFSPGRRKLVVSIDAAKPMTDEDVLVVLAETVARTLKAVHWGQQA